MQRSHVVIAVLCIATILGLALNPEPLMAQTPSGCAGVVANGGFETVSDWVFGASPSPPQYSSANRHTGNWSLLLGISDGANRESFSSARQTVTIPPSAQSAALSFWVYTIASGAPDTDYMELALLSPDGSTILAKPWYSHSDNRAWSQLVFDISAWRGRTFQLYFNVFNDGLGGMAQMYLDDVSLVACPNGSGGSGGGGLVTPALPTGAPITPTRGACPNPVLPCFATPKTPSAEATPQPTRATPAADQQPAQSTPVIIAPPTGGAAMPAIIEPAATGQESPIVITVAPAQPGVSPELVLPPLIELTAAPDVSLLALGPEPGLQGDPAGETAGSRLVGFNPVAPSVTRIALVVTDLPVAPDPVPTGIESPPGPVTPFPRVTPETPASSRRRITDQWPNYWWLIPIGFIAVFVLIWLLARRSK